MATHQDTLLQGRKVADFFVRQVPLREIGQFRQLESDPAALVAFCVTDVDLDAIRHETFLELLDACQEVNGPLARRLETEEAKASARQMALLREHQPALYEQAETQMVEQLKTLMTAGATLPVSSPASAESAE